MQETKQKECGMCGRIECPNLSLEGYRLLTKPPRRHNMWG